MDYDVPFISNTPEDKQCLQASYAMIRQYFEPELDIDWDKWAEFTGYLPGKGAWSMAGLLWFKDHGYDVVHIATYDYADFARRGPKYLLDALEPEVAAWGIRFTDFALEQPRALKFVASGIWIQRSPTLEDVRHYLREGYLIKCAVNLNALNNKPGYLSHAVVVKGITHESVILHDPGLPARPNRRVPINDFMAAWGESDVPQADKFDAIRKLSHINNPWIDNAPDATVAEPALA